MITMKKNVEGITVKTVRPEGGIYEQCSDILLNWRDIRSKFGYKTLCEIARIGKHNGYKPSTGAVSKMSLRRC